MKKGLQELFGHSIDYAGLFPPASLTLEEAIKNYLEYAQSPLSIYLGNFVTVYRYIESLNEILENISDRMGNSDSENSISTDSIPLTVILSEDDAVSTIKDLLCTEVIHDSIKLCSFELKLSETLCNDSDLEDLLKQIVEVMQAAGLPDIRIYFEVLQTGDAGKDDLAFSILASNVARFKSKVTSTDGDHLMGLKCRFANAEAKKVPGIDLVCAMLITAMQAGLPLKATQGLHHLLSNKKGDPRHCRFGYLSLFVACGLLCGSDITKDDLETLLAEENVENFKIRGSSISWRNYRLTIQEIREARRRFLSAFGSCSFTEPLNELKRIL